MFRAHVLIIRRSKLPLYSLWYRHTETSEWSKITEIQFYKYEHMVVKFVYESQPKNPYINFTHTYAWFIFFDNLKKAPFFDVTLLRGVIRRHL